MENRGKGMAGYELISLLPGFWEVSRWKWGLGPASSFLYIVSSPLGKLEMVKSLQTGVPCCRCLQRLIHLEASEPGQAAGVQGP